MAPHWCPTRPLTREAHPLLLQGHEVLHLRRRQHKGARAGTRAAFRPWALRGRPSSHPEACGRISHKTPCASRPPRWPHLLEHEAHVSALHGQACRVRRRVGLAETRRRSLGANRRRRCGAKCPRQGATQVGTAVRGRSPARARNVSPRPPMRGVPSSSAPRTTSGMSTFLPLSMLRPNPLRSTVSCRTGGRNRAGAHGGRRGPRGRGGWADCGGAGELLWPGQAHPVERAPRLPLPGQHALELRMVLHPPPTIKLPARRTFIDREERARDDLALLVGVADGAGPAARLGRALGRVDAIAGGRQEPVPKLPVATGLLLVACGPARELVGW